MPGFPIRTSSDPRSVDNSPRHIAASHVLHRLPVPRHPPCALKHLQHKNQKMSFHKITIQTEHTNPTPKKGQSLCALDARNHYPQIKHHTPPPKRGNNTLCHPTATAGPKRTAGLVVSKPNSVSGSHHRNQEPKPSIPLQHYMFVVHPTPDHYSLRVPHGSHPLGRECLSWCSLERR